MKIKPLYLKSLKSLFVFHIEILYIIKMLDDLQCKKFIGSFSVKYPRYWELKLLNKKYQIILKISVRFSNSNNSISIQFENLLYFNHNNHNNNNVLTYIKKMSYTSLKSIIYLLIISS